MLFYLYSDGECFPTNTMVFHRQRADSKAIWEVRVGRYRGEFHHSDDCDCLHKMIGCWLVIMFDQVSLALHTLMVNMLWYWNVITCKLMERAIPLKQLWKCWVAAVQDWLTKPSRDWHQWLKVYVLKWLTSIAFLIQVTTDKCYLISSDILEFVLHSLPLLLIPSHTLHISFCLVECPVDHTREFNCEMSALPAPEDFDADKVRLFIILFQQYVLAWRFHSR